MIDYSVENLASQQRKSSKPGVPKLFRVVAPFFNYNFSMAPYYILFILAAQEGASSCNRFKKLSKLGTTGGNLHSLSLPLYLQ